jgi:CO/xanthine dehydrogenase FAD-binding subunit
MKAAPFDYVRPRTLDEACNITARDPDAVLIAGGQTLVPMLAMRLARPSMLVDIHRLPELQGIQARPDRVVVGACTRQIEIERSPVIARDVPLLARAIPWVGHRPTRSRGTIGGSIANADPAAEIGLVAVTLDAELHFKHATTKGSTRASTFFVGPMQTSLAAGACLTTIDFPIWADWAVGTGFHEISSRRSDFALAASAAQVAIDDGGACRRVAVGVGGTAPRPLALEVGGLIGTRLTESDICGAVEAAMANVEIMEDPHASAHYRRRAAIALAVRALTDAMDAARNRSTGRKP